MHGAIVRLVLLLVELALVFRSSVGNRGSYVGWPSGFCPLNPVEAYTIYLTHQFGKCSNGM